MVAERLGSLELADLSEPRRTVVPGLAFRILPPSGAPRVIWLDVTRGAAEIVALHAEIGRRLTGEGFARELRPFSPHLTLARVPDRERGRVKSLRERLQAIETMAIGWTATWVTLFRSDLSAAVPRYEPLHEIEIRKNV